MMQLSLEIVNCVTIILTAVLVRGQERATPSEDIPISDLVSLVISNDDKLCEQCSQNKKGDGKVIVSLMKGYNNAFADIITRVSGDLKEGSNKTKIEAEPLFKHGCPRFINFYVEPEVIGERFKVDNATLSIILSQRQKAIDHWVDFFALFCRIPDLEGVPIVLKN